MEKHRQKPIEYFLYRRKSTDEPDRQILSLESQHTEAIKRFGNLDIITLPPESVSAFKPDKRPVFNEMVKRIQRGEAQGIISWHPDRLSRNSIDAAQIIYLLDIGKLRDLKFCTYTFDNSPEGKMMLQIVMSQSKYTSDKLSTDVKRGMDKKARAGWRPGLAPLGYKNSKTGIRGEQVLYKDNQRFELVRQAWNLMLTGNYTVPRILALANTQWKLTQPGTRKRPERALRLGKLYRVFTTPFYYGYYRWGDEWIKGKHEAMITQEEYDRVQSLLGRKGKPRPKTHLFAFTGLVRCGSCRAMVTAEEKVKHQKNGNVHHYTYYRCTHNTSQPCRERAVELKELTRQIDAIIAKVTISEGFRNWAIKYLHEIRKDQAKAQEQMIESRQRRYQILLKQLDGLVLKYTSPENADGALITDGEYTRLRSQLQQEKSRLEESLDRDGSKINEWVELSERTFNFARYARIWFAKGGLGTQRAILACLGSDLVLKDKKLLIELKKPFRIIEEGLAKSHAELEGFGLVKTPKNEAKSGKLTTEFPLLSGIANDVRTYWQTTAESFDFPVLSLEEANLKRVA